METAETAVEQRSLLFPVATTVLVIFVVIKIWKHFHDQRYFERINVPYRKTVPFFGNMFPLISQSRTYADYITDIYYEFRDAKYSGLFEFGHRVFFIRDPELIKAMLVKHFDHFPNHRPFVDESTDPFFGGNIFFMQDERWKEMRSIVSPVFTASKMRNMFELMNACARNFADHMTKQPQPLTLEWKDAFTRYTNDMIATTAFGVSVNSVDNRENEFYLNGRDATSFTGLRLMKILMISMIPKVMKFFGFSVLPQKLYTFFHDIVKETIEMRRREGISRPDLINLLMDAKHKDTDKKLTTEEMTAQAFIFFSAGFETSSTLMSFACYMLAVHPEVQERLIAEVDEVFEMNNGVLSYETVNHLVYMEMVLNETLRLFPPLSFTERVTSQEFELPPIDENSKPVKIYPGDRIWIPMYPLHHDPEHFPEPEKFNPERFSAANKDKVHPFVFLPFGGGPRMCPGNRFALMETKLVMCNLLRKFRLRKCEKTQYPPVLKKGLPTVSTEHGIWLRIEPREAK